MNAPHMLRVTPHESVGDLPVPLPGGVMLTRAMAGPSGWLVADSLHVRRRIGFNELTLLAEGAAALPPSEDHAA